MIPTEIVAQLPSLGVAGLLFVMWWIERQERTRGLVGLRDALEQVRRVGEINDGLLDVIRGNTAALTALREELRAQRDSDAHWRQRLAEQLEELACQ